MKLNTFIRSVSLTAVSVFAVLAMNFGSAFAGWSPIRPTFNWATPASYITFNSFTDNPQYGDERAFLDVRDLNSATVTDKITVTDGNILVLRMYYHNNANTTLNLTAVNTRVRVALPIAPAINTYANAHISATNANPVDVTDTVDFTGANLFTVSYIPGSAQIWNAGATNGMSLSDNIVTASGALIGYSALDGSLPGCSQFSGYVTLKVRVSMPSPVAPVTPATPVTPTPVTPVVKPVVAPVIPARLPNTGAGSSLGIVAGVALASTASYYIVASRRIKQ